MVVGEATAEAVNAIVQMVQAASGDVMEEVVVDVMAEGEVADGHGLRCAQTQDPRIAGVHRLLSGLLLCLALRQN